jgi:aerobic-type carbon monoxide dehydrogenase small subunit (CoxS/CutS family)
MQVARVNGVPVEVPEDDTRLIDWLRTSVGLISPKEGCGQGHCGACTVLVDGRPALSCVTFAALAAGKEIQTAEGLVESPLGNRLAQSFAARGAIQCGYCTPGMLAVSFFLLGQGVPLADADVRQALVGNVCRCTGYAHIVAAVMAAQHGS